MSNRIFHPSMHPLLCIVLIHMLLSLVSCSSPSTPSLSSSSPAPSTTPSVPHTEDNTRTTENSTTAPDTTIRLFYWQTPTILNPYLTGAGKDLEVARLTYEPLASFDKQGTMIPFLAETIPSHENGGVTENGRTVTWKLKQGITWCDGVPFTAEDVRFTYEYITNPDVNSQWAATYEHITRVDVLDDHTLTILFDAPTPSWNVPFVGLQGLILPEHIFAPYNGPHAANAPINLNPVGTGPYCFESIASGPKLQLGGEFVETRFLVFTRNPGFRQANDVFFQRVEVTGGGAVEKAAEAVFKNGTADYAWNLQLDAELLNELETFDKGHVVGNVSQNIERILLNRTNPQAGNPDEQSSTAYPHPLFSDKRVRQALAHAIDREKIAELYGPFAFPTTNNLVAPAIYNSPNTDNLYPFDLDKAAALLDEANWTDTDGDGIRDKEGTKLHITYQTTVNPLRQKTQDIVKQDLETIGIDVTLKIVDVSLSFGNDPFHPDYFTRFNADIQEYFDGNGITDPSNYMGFWTCDEIPTKDNAWSGNNVERWCSPDYDSLYQQSTTELDPEKRRLLFIQMNDMLIEDVVLIPLFQRVNVSGINTNITGIDMTPWDADVWNIHEWRRK